jgi:AcrR family transcriptional regulator
MAKNPSRSQAPLVSRESDGKPAEEIARLGRKRDPSRDIEILNVTLELLSEVGYERLTTEMVAGRAKVSKATMYRRWATKAELIVDAVAFMKKEMVDLHALPDTGSFRSDILSLFKKQPAAETDRKMRIVAGLVSMLSQNRNLADAVNDAMTAPWVAVHKVLINRAIERGELSKDVKIDIASQIIPSMATYRSLVLQKPFDKEFLVELVDDVLLPILGLKTI